MATTIKVVSDEIEKGESPELQQYKSKLEKVLEKIYNEYDANSINQLSQLLGEAHFLIECEKLNISLSHIPEGKEKTPDFETTINNQKICFEVKTFSIVNGEFGIKEETYASLDSQIELDKQIKDGQKVAFSVRESNMYGDKLYRQGRNKQLTNTIKILIEKYDQNFKSGQYTQPTISVINLMLLQNHAHNAILRPYYPIEYTNEFKTTITGELWAMAFGTHEMIVQYYPEFEGKPTVEGKLEKLGILNRDEPNVLGVIFMIYSFSKYIGMYGLSNFNRLESTTEEIFDKIVGDNWNDSGDSNGWQLQNSTLQRS
jgi:hypothetical protein